MSKREIPEINAGSMADIAFLLLIFFLVTTTMDKDQAYIRSIPKKVEIVKTDPVVVEERNIFAVQANKRDQLMIRGEMIENPDDISERVMEFYTTNERINTVTNNFPLYSRISMPEIEAQILAAEEDAEATEKTPNVMPDIVDFKWRIVDEWNNKKRALQQYGKKQLPEIHAQAHIRIEVQKETGYELFAKIQSELEEAIYELRDKAAREIYNESYGTITRRYNMDKNIDEKRDKDKIDLLKVLYPDRFIEVTPK